MFLFEVAVHIEGFPRGLSQLANGGGPIMFSFEAAVHVEGLSRVHSNPSTVDAQ